MDYRALVQKLGDRTNQNSQTSELILEHRTGHPSKKVNLHKVHPHKFRRTLATMAIDKGMPIEQVQKMLGHVKIDTTLHYAMVNQANVKMAHRKFLN